MPRRQLGLVSSKQTAYRADPGSLYPSGSGAIGNGLTAETTHEASGRLVGAGAGRVQYGALRDCWTSANPATSDPTPCRLTRGLQSRPLGLRLEAGCRSARGAAAFRRHGALPPAPYRPDTPRRWLQDRRSRQPMPPSASIAAGAVRGSRCHCLSRHPERARIGVHDDPIGVVRSPIPSIDGRHSSGERSGLSRPARTKGRVGRTPIRQPDSIEWPRECGAVFVAGSPWRLHLVPTP